MDFIKLHNLNIDPLLSELVNLQIFTFVDSVDESTLTASNYLVTFEQWQYNKVPHGIYTMQLGVLIDLFKAKGVLDPEHYGTINNIDKLRTLTNNFDPSYFMPIVATYVHFFKLIAELQRIYFHRVSVLNKEDLLMRLDALTSLHAHYDSVLDGTSTKVIDETNTKHVIELINLCESLYPIIIKEHENVKAVYSAIINYLIRLKPYLPLLECRMNFIKNLIMPIVQLMFNNLENVTLHSKYIESIMAEIKYLKEIMSKAVPSIEFKNVTNIEVINSESNVNTINSHTIRVLPNNTKRSYGKLKNIISSTHMFTIKQSPSDGIVGVRVKDGIRNLFNNSTNNKYSTDGTLEYIHNVSTKINKNLSSKIGLLDFSNRIHSTSSNSLQDQADNLLFNMPNHFASVSHMPQTLISDAFVHVMPESMSNGQELTELVDLGFLIDSNISIERIADIKAMQVPQPPITLHAFTSSDKSSFSTTETGNYIVNTHPDSTKIFDMPAIIPSHNIVDTLKIMHFSPKAHMFCKNIEPLIVNIHEKSAEVIKILKLSNCLDETQFTLPYTMLELIKLEYNRLEIEHLYKLESAGKIPLSTLDNFLYNMWLS